MKTLLVFLLLTAPLLGQTKFKRHANKAAALAQSAAICDRVMTQPANERTTKYWYSVEEDEDTGVAVMIVKDESRLTLAERAELVEETGLSQAMQDRRLLMNLRDRVDSVTGNRIYNVLMRVGPVKLRRMKREFRDDTDFRTLVYQKMTIAQRNAVIARIQALP